MNKTVKIILQILSYVITAILGATGGATMMWRKTLDIKFQKGNLKPMENTRFKISQYVCAVLLIVSSIALVTYQVISIDDVAAGLLYYVAQSFLLAGSIFGLDQYIRIIKKQQHENTRT